MTTAPTVDRRKALWAGSRGAPVQGRDSPDFAGCALDDRYELHALIGEGAFGCVYRGLDRRLARPVAVKVIKPCWADDAAWVERFQREAQLLARVNAPGIVQIFDVGHAREGPYYVAELSTARASPNVCSAAPCRSPVPATSPSSSAGRSRARTPRESCTATSSPPTSCLPPRAGQSGRFWGR